MGVILMGSYSIDFDKMSSTLSDLRSEISVDKELSTFVDVKTQLETISSQHENFLSGFLDNLDPNGSGLASSFKKMNEKYNSLVNSLEVTVGYSGVDTNGGVEGTGSTGGVGSSSYSGGGSYSSSSATPVTGTGTPSSSTLSQLSSSAGKSSPTISSDGVLSRKLGGSSTGGSHAATSVGSVGSTTGTSALTSAQGAMSTGGVVSTVGGALGGTTLGAVAGEVGGLGGTGTTSLLSSTNYSMGNYHVGDNFREEFNDSERQSVTNILENYGYSKEEIDTIFNGEYDTSNVLVEGVSSSLGDAVRSNPGLREEIINQYGFDVFNTDGSVNNDKLSMALYIDDLNGKDNYSMISLLSNNGVNLVDPGSLNNYSDQFESLILKDYSVKDKIINQYGFDIYNTDGTVNKDRLTLAMLIDSKKGDGITLSSIANEAISSDINSYLNTSIKSVNSGSVRQNSKSNFTPVAAILAAGGAAAGIGAVVHGKKKEENHDDGEDNKTNKYIDTENNKSDWVTKMLEEEK